MLNQLPMSKKEFLEWRMDPRTKEVYSMIRLEREEWVKKLIYGGTLCGSGPTEQETARAVGVIYGIDLLLEANWEEEE